ncbi:MAG: protein arginine kinase [Candidatus Latescibacteria bacterium]|nr:protein arginine kinase [Candidatus Latescibacterota bacterium]NIM20948.1 protein arginine kinase [Candidatus Latescibacterota bacterium]NIM65083.1 protein arginine kinase [Candidatus Latescibacterota bacterium]NIO01598.1 protein arginine kinase [Candidatus Latescibacterota bacterium]NIO28115.1 protein arginine kinase [Candidatus Latescibacterota bacterium]
MLIEEMIKHPASWLLATGDECEVVLSSRVRLARNLEKHRFTHNAGGDELAAILDESHSAADQTKTFEDGFYFPMGSVPELNRQFLVERHLVSTEFLSSSSNRGLVVNKSQDVCLMINEEDHLRLQAYSSGFDLMGALSRVNKLDNELAPKLEFAFSERLGFLTACPTNLGTGLRASVLMHLPGLVHSKEIHKLLEHLRKIHHSIRGLYGEGTDIMGNFFQISNSATLGSQEEEILNNLGNVVTNLINLEQQARKTILQKARSLLEDKVWRAYGLLKYARRVDTKEALSLISAVRLGMGMGIIGDLTVRKLNELLIYVQPAHLQIASGNTMDQSERDHTRATYIRRKLSTPDNVQED